MSKAEKPMLDGTVEMDETYVGGKKKGRGPKAGLASKEIVIGIRQRNGELRFFHARTPSPEHSQSTSAKTSVKM